MPPGIPRSPTPFRGWIALDVGDVRASPPLAIGRAPPRAPTQVLPRRWSCDSHLWTSDNSSCDEVDDEDRGKQKEPRQGESALSEVRKRSEEICDERWDLPSPRAENVPMHKVGL